MPEGRSKPNKERTWQKVVLAILPALIVAGFVWSANFYYNLDTSTVKLEEKKEISVSSVATALTVSQSGTGYAAIITGGNVGIGTTSPSEMLSIKATSTTPILGVYTSSTAPALYINSAGNVGIGTTAPITQLHVPGKAPSSVATIPTGTYPVSIYVQGRYAYVVNWSANTLQIFDVSNPASPSSVAATTTGAGPYSVYVQGRYAYVANNGTNTLQIFDVSNPALPSSVATTTTSYPQSVYVQGRYAYVVGNSLLQIFDVSNPSSPSSVATTTTGAGPYSVYVQGRYAYVANQGANTLQIFDVSNPSSPSSVATANTGAGSSPYSVYVQGRYAYVANQGANTLQIFDVSNPALPTSVATTTTGINPYSVYVQGRYAYVVNYYNGAGGSTLQIFDVSNPASPTSVATTTTGLSPISVYVLGRYAYVVNYIGSTLQIFDVGGAYIQQLEAGGIETGTLQTRNNLTVNNDADIRGGLQIGRGLNVTGPSGIYASSGVAVLTVSQTGIGNIIDFKNATGSVFVIANNGNITTGSWQATPIGATWGGTGTSTASWTGVPYITTGVWGTTTVQTGTEKYGPTVIVAAQNSTTTSRAQYQCDGTDDEVEINQAIQSIYPTGGTIQLLEGTYNIATSTSYLYGIQIATSNVALIGSGKATILRRAWNETALYNSGVITVGDGTNAYEGILISQLQIDGNKGSYTNPNNHAILFKQKISRSQIKSTWVYNSSGNGIYLYAASSGNSNSYNLIEGNDVKSNNYYGIYLNYSSYNTITGNTFQGNSLSGILLSVSSNNNTITGNTSQGNSSHGIQLYSSSNNNTITGNTSQGNSDSGIFLSVSSNNNTITGNTFQGNSDNGIYLYNSSNNNTITGNTSQGNSWNGIYLNNSANNNTVTGNKIYDNGSTEAYSGIDIYSSDANLISSNDITDATGTGYAINISDSGSDNNYLVGNRYSGTGASSINDAGAGTVYGSQLFGSAPLATSTAPNLILNSSGLVGIGTTTPSAILDVYASSTATGLIIRQLGTGTIADFKNATGSVFVIANNGDITTGTWKATAIGAAYGGTGTTTASWTGVPYITAGTWGTTTVQVGTEKYGPTVIVAAQNSTNTARAHYQCDGTNDQDEINQAIQSIYSTGGTVQLLEGTYNIATSTGYLYGVQIATSNIALIGSGKATILRRAWNETTANNSGVITVGDGTNAYEGILISQLQIDGASTTYTAANNHGILFKQKVSRSQIKSTWVYANAGNGIYLYAASDANSNFYNLIEGNDLRTSAAGLWLNYSSNNTITGNTAQGNSMYGGILIVYSSNNTITGNTSQATGRGIYLSASPNNTVTGNTFQGNSNHGIYLGSDSPNNTITGNTSQGNSMHGIFLESSNNNTVTGNKIYDNGSSGAYDGIRVESNSDANLISSNDITDTAGTGYAINIVASTEDNNYLVGNRYSGTGANSIQDLGTGTIYGSQLYGASASADLILKPLGNIGIGSTSTSAKLTVLESGAGTIVDIKNATGSVFVIANNGDITTGTWKATPIGATWGGTGTSTISWTGVPYITAGTWGTTTVSTGADHYGPTVIVAAQNSTNTARANFQCDGTNDQEEINAAISAISSTGGTVLLLEGNFFIASSTTAGINIATSNIAIVGSGRNTILHRDWDTASNDGVITVGDGGTSTSTGVVIANLSIDGCKATSTVSACKNKYEGSENIGIFFNQKVSQSKIQNTWIHNCDGYGIMLSQSTVTKNLIKGNDIRNCDKAGIYLGADNNIVTENVLSSNGSSASDGNENIFLVGNYNIISNNILGSSPYHNIQLSSANYNTITGNSITLGGNDGIYIYSSMNNVIANNEIYLNASIGIAIWWSSSRNTIIGNLIYDNGQTEIEINGCLSNCSNNLISSNNIWDNAGAGISINDANAVGTYIIGNEISGVATKISDGGTGTTIQHRDWFEVEASSTIAALTVSQTGTGTIAIFSNATGSVFTIANNGTVTVAGNILPATTTAYNLGSATYKWANIYAATATIGSTITINSNTISGSTSTTLNTTDGNIILSPAGYVGIGTSSPVSLLSVYGTTTIMGGNVGIGTTGPESALDVSGKLIVRGEWGGRSWKLNYDGAKEYIMNFAVYNGKLYAAQGNTAGAGDVFVFDGTSWSTSSDGNQEVIYGMAVYNGKLYVGQGSGTGDGDVFVFDGTSWSTSSDGNQEVIYGMAVYNGKLYVGQGSGTGDGDVLVFDGTTWSTSYNGASERIYALAVYNGKLYAGQGATGVTTDGDVLVFDGTTWSTSYDGSQDLILALAVYNGKLYAGQAGSVGETVGDIYVFDGTTWSLSYDGSKSNIYALAVYNGKLYAGEGGATAGYGDALVFNGKTWSVSYDGNQETIYSLGVYNGKLYAGQGSGTGDGDIYVFEDNLGSQLTNLARKLDYLSLGSPRGEEYDFNKLTLAGNLFVTGGGISYFAGNVGIGTTTPSAILDVYASSSATGLIIRQLGTGTIADFKNATGSVFTIANNGDVTVAGNILPATTTAYNLGSATYKWANIYAATATIGSTITINSNTISGSGTTTINTTAGSLILNPAGNVGIGTASPISGTQLTINDTGSGGNAQLIVRSRLNDTVFSLYTDNDVDEVLTPYITFNDGGGNGIFIKGDGSLTGTVFGPAIGIGDDLPDAALEVIDDFMVSSAADNNGDLFIVQSSGNVGIGTTTPVALLDVYASSSATGLTIRQLGTGTIADFKNATGSVFTIANNGDITVGTWKATPIGASWGGTGTTTASWTGVPYITAGTWSTTTVQTGTEKYGPTVIVAASNSTNTTRAHYQCDGTNDQDEIMAAINSIQSTGGTIQLLEGTYNIASSTNYAGINIATSSISLIGSGKNTILKRAWDTASNDGVITVGDGGTSTSTGVVIANLSIDGQKVTYTGAQNIGIFFNQKVTQSKIQNTWVYNNDGVGIFLYGTSGARNTQNLIQGNDVRSNDDSGIWLEYSDSNIISGNSSQSNDYGIFLKWSNYNTVTGNTVQGSNFYGISLSGSPNNAIADNIVQGNKQYGIRLYASFKNTIAGNKIDDNGSTFSYDGIEIMNNSDDNLISSNDITDTAGTGYAIDIPDSDCNNNYLVGNRYSGTGASSINDAGTGTIYGSQLYGTSTVADLILKPLGNVGIGTTTPSAILDVYASSTATGLIIRQLGTGTIADFKNATGSVFTIANNGDVTVAGNILPATTTAYNLGSATYKWANIYAATATIGSTITINSNTISGSGTTTLTTSAGSLILSPTANVGIGTTTPASLLTVGSSGAGFQVGTSGIVTAGTWQGTKIDISDYTNLTVAVGAIVLTGDQLSHSTADGYIHIPSAGSSAQILQYSAAGTAKWITVSSDITIADNGAVVIAANAVTNTKLRDSGALSVIGRSANSTGDPADISATAASGAVLRESGSTLGFGTIATAGIADNAVTLAKMADMATLSVIGRSTAATGDPEVLTATADNQVLRRSGTTLGFGTISVIDSTTGTLTVDRGGTGLTSATAGYTLIGSTASALQATSTLFVSSAGNVGIGTTTPASLLTVGSSGAGFQVGTSGIVTAGTWNGNVITTTYGGTGLSSYTAGDILYYSAGTLLSKVGIGVANKYLTSSGSAPAWSTYTISLAGNLTTASTFTTAGAFALTLTTTAITNATLPAGTVTLMSNPMTTAGDIIYGGTGGTPTRYGIGAGNTVLTSSGSAPQWSTNIAVGALPTGGNWDITTDLTIETPTLFIGAIGGSYPGRVGIGTTTPNNTIQVKNLINFNDSIYGTFLGYQAGAGTTGSYNTALGYQALYSNTTGGYNTALGSYALYTNTGTGNIALGYSALYSNTVSLNMALGVSAGSNNTSGTPNTYIGYAAGYYNQTGVNNTIIGYNAGGYGAGAVNSFSYNTIIGDSAGYKLTIGTYNTAIGYQALYSNTAGNFNVALGQQALLGNTTGSNNIAIGYQALSANTGSNNIGLGYIAGNNISTGANNIIIGYDIDAPSATANSQLSIGNLIFATGGFGTGTTVGTGNVGIGTATPGQTLDVAGIIKGTGFYTTSNAASGWYALRAEAPNNGYGFIGSYVTTGGITNPTFEIRSSGDLKWGAGGTSAVDTNLYRYATNTLITNSSFIVSGSVGIGTASPGYKLVVVDSAYPTLPTAVATIVALGSSNDLTTGVSIRARGTITGGLADIGEYVKVMGDPNDYEQGDLLRIGPEPGKFNKTQASYDPTLAGVISDAPGIVAGGGQDDLSQHRIMALAGQTQVKVSSENGPIEIGDPLTSASSTPGVAMKATKAGRVIGIALETFPKEGQDPSASSGQVMVFVNPHWIGNDLAVQENASGQIVNLDPEQLRAGLAVLGLVVTENGSLEVQKLKAKTVVTEQIEMKDKATGEIYCTWIENGEWVKVKGECGGSQQPSVVQPSAEQPPIEESPVEEPLVEQPPAEEQPTVEQPPVPSADSGAAEQATPEPEIAPAPAPEPQPQPEPQPEPQPAPQSEPVSEPQP